MEASQKFRTRALMIILGGALAWAGCPSAGTGGNIITPAMAGVSQGLRPELTGSGAVFTSLGQPAVALGDCVTPDGVPTGQSCIQNVAAVDRALRSDLGKTNVRIYSALLSVSAGVNGTGGTASGSSKIYYSKHRFVLEWARYRTQTAQIPAEQTGPLVRSVDVGLAVRAIFDVQLQSTDSNIAANFGFGQLAAALATKSAQISVAYDSVGTQNPVLPPAGLFSVSDINGFIQAQNSYYAGIQKIEEAWADYVKTGRTTPAPESQPSSGPPVLTPTSNPNGFVPDIVSYSVVRIPSESVDSNTVWATGYLNGIRAITRKISCEDALKAIKLNAPSQNLFYTAALFKAYKDVMSVSGCDTTAPDDIQAAKARAAIEPYGMNFTVRNVDAPD
ncbi:hypothetical protein [Stigmatella erecta]|uniref:Uncharacterized protein n=1 Tax=Stigmatella erecta TaxID=83460 RepID=A0A1I0LFW0_9BACT|nr:hypothetical protein [Stigmatella erecta]SEU38982.1 hypothetical protein SAMN05443639_1311 [Stigmatella erecta]